MDQERWRKIEEVFQTVAESDHGDRRAYLTQLCNGDGELQHEVESLLAHEVFETFIQEPIKGMAQTLAVPVESDLVGVRLGAYRVTALIGSGGMGAVYAAVRDDDQFTQQVAVKVVKRGMDSSFVLNRFHAERQILASLEHPNIARLFDGGTTADGRPYFVMEFIEGQTISEYCVAHQLSVADRVKLFRQVCAAVQYAHQKLVAHRDIKPSNILVNRDGEPKLLDFGIAKLVDPAQTEADPARTATIMRMMTPDYASPEQVRGLAMTTATDVYSLGAVLYELLTGQRPHRFQSYTPTEIERVVCETEIVRPSDVSERMRAEGGRMKVGRFFSHPSCFIPHPSSLRGDLDNIVLMAMRKEPERRYASVEQFSEDLRRHLEGLPVIACSDTVGYRAGKFIRRHKFGLAATAMVIVSLLGGLIAANYQARRAERRFGQVRKLANTFLFDFHDKIQPLSGSTEARELVVKTGLEYLDSLAQESGSDDTLLLELAQAYLKVGDVQGEPFLPNLGHTEAAMQSYRKAMTLAERLTGKNGMNVAALQTLTSTYFKLGALQSELGDKPGAQATLRSGLTVALKTAQQTGEVKDIVRVTNIYTRLGETQLHMGDPAAALATYRQSQQISKQRAITHPSDNAQASVAISYENIGQAVGAQGDPANAIANYRQAADLLEPLAAKQPANTYFTRELRTTYTWLSSFYGNPHFLNLGDSETALRYIRQSLAISEKLVAADEKNARARLDLMNDYRNLADLLAEAEPQRAIDHYKKSLSVIRPLLEASPNDFNLRLSQVDKIIRISDVLQAAGKSSEAETNLLPGLASLRQLQTEDATSIEVQANLHYALKVMGKTLTKSGNYESAMPYYRQAIDIAQRIAASSPAEMRWQRRLANSYTILAEHHAALAQQPGLRVAERIAGLRQASHEYQSALVVWDAWNEHGISSVFNVSQRNQTARAVAQCEAALEKLGVTAQH